MPDHPPISTCSTDLRQGRGPAAQPGASDRTEVTLAVDRLVAAASSPDRMDFDREMAALRAAGLGPDLLAETLIPEAARALGLMWCDDRAGFATVTIGCARLQGSLRRLAADWHGTDGDDPAAASVMVLTPPQSLHTLGATVLTGLLRRRGVNAFPMIGCTLQQIEEMLGHRRFDAILISADVGSDLEILRRLSEIVLTSAVARPHLILGGALVEDAGFDRAAARSMIGVDHVTNSIDEALDHCAIHPMTMTTPEPDAAMALADVLRS